MMYLGNMSRAWARVLGVVFCVTLPQIVFGEFWISEIHYNPEGSDSGLEWVEGGRCDGR